MRKLRDRGGVAHAVIAENASRSRGMSQHDVLTDLPNRLLWKGRLPESIARASRNHKQLAVLFLDLDGFKHINDSLGHDVGDKLLQSVAARISACVRKSDTVGRRAAAELGI